MHKLLLEREGNLRGVSREPMTAAMLSLIPGAGQLYNGQSMKGLLFMDVALINFVLLWVVMFAQPMTEALRKFLLTNHVRPNDGVLSAVASTHFGAPFSFIVLSMVALFATYAIRDAYDSAAKTRRGPIYAAGVIDIPEATSGSYLLHCASMFCFAILALFFLIPPPVQRQYTEIEFLSNPVERQKPKETKVLSENNSAAKGDRETHKPKPIASKNAASASRPVQPAHEAARVAPPTKATSQPKTTPAPTPPTPAPPAAATPKQPVKVQTPPAQPAPPTPRPAQPAPSNHLPAPTLVHPTPQIVGESKPAPAAAPLPTLTSRSTQLAQLPSPIQLPVSTSGIAMPQAQPVSGHSKAGNPAPAARSSNSGSQGAQNGAPRPMPVSNPGPGGSGSQGAPAAPSPAAAGPSHSSTTGPSSGAPQPTKVASSAIPGQGFPSVVPRAGDHGGPVKEDNSQGAEKGKGDSANRRKAVDFGAYMAELERRIKRNWTPPRIPLSKRVVAKFVISRAGALSGLAVSSSSGSASVDQAALRAIENSAPFAPLPEGADENVDIQFTFDYNVFGGSGGGHATSF